MKLPFHDRGQVVQSWYVVARSRELKRGRAITRSLADRRLALYRGASGRAYALDARCAHLGADLGQGCVVGEHLRCAFHHWSYDASGRCVEIPTQSRIPSFARTFAYPVEERYGALWVWNGPEPRFPIPHFEGWREEDLSVLATPPQKLNAHPHVVASNGLDVHHFRTLHHCELLEEPILVEPDSHRIEVRLRLRLVGAALHERALRLLAGREVSARFATWGGNLATITGTAGGRPLLVLFTMRPLADGRSASQSFLFVPRRRGWRRWLGGEAIDLTRTIACMAHVLAGDRRLLDGIRFQPHLVEADAPLAAFIRQVNRMETFTPGEPRGPETPAPAPPLVPSRRKPPIEPSFPASRT